MTTPPLADRLQFLFDYVYPAQGAPYTQAKAAQKASTDEVLVTTQQIHGILSGRTKSPQFSTVATLADFFNVPLDFFWTGDEDTWNEYVRWIKTVRERMDSTDLFAARSDRWQEIRRNRLAKKSR